MGRLRFVKPESVRYDLSDGDWVELKKFLNVREQAQLEGAGVPTFRQQGTGDARDQRFELDFVALKIARIEAYALAWSFTDAKGNQTQPTRENIELLDPETVAEIDGLIDEHRKKASAEKNAPTSGPAGATT